MNGSVTSKKTSNQSLLQQKIRILKNEIQDLINQDKQSSDYIDNNKYYEELKHEKMIELQNLTLQFKNTKLNSEYDKISRTTDSMEYARLKNKPNGVDVLNNIKDKRQKAKEEFEKIKDIEEKYSKLENELFNQTKFHLPGFLFFHKDIIDKYGMCPYINIFNNNPHNNDAHDDSSTDIIEKRDLWLKNQEDGGKLYNTIYNKIINKSNYTEYIKEFEELDMHFQNLHNNLLNDSQKNILEDAISYLEEYANHSIKTKKIKEKFKIIINNISLLVMELGLNIHRYLYFKTNVDIPINEIKANISCKNNLINIGVSDDYNLTLEKFSLTKESIANSIRYVNNVTKELKYALSEYLYNESLRSRTHVVKYSGKYFKKWSLLLENEKIERLEYFSNYFVQKYLVNAKLIEQADANIKIEELSKILVDAYKIKLLKYKYIKWNIKNGVIEKIFALKYDNENQKFFLDIYQETKTDVDDDLNKSMNQDNDEVNKESSSNRSEENELREENKTTSKKQISNKTIFNKMNEKIINEEILIFIIKNKHKSDKINELKDKFHDLIKLKLKLKRLNTNDKQKIYEKFDEILNVVEKNSY